MIKNFLLCSVYCITLKKLLSQSELECTLAMYHVCAIIGGRKGGAMGLQPTSF